MDIFKIGLIVLVSLILVNSLPTFSREISMLISFSVCTVVLLYIINSVIPAIEYIKNMAEKINYSGMEIIIKAFGIGFITQFISDTALDCNNKTLANQMIFAGRVAVLLLAMPVFIHIFEIIERLI